MDFRPKNGCPMCGIVAKAARQDPLDSPIASSFAQSQSAPEILWRDENFTAYRERVNPVSSKGHIVIAFNLHVPSLYDLSSSDVPLLVSLKNLGQRLLTSATVAPPSSESRPSTPISAFHPSMTAKHTSAPLSDTAQLHIGFITPPWGDNKIPVKDHLHAHAYVGNLDLAGWWRSISYSSLAWYAIEDLIAEIRESTTNNRVRSGYEERPIDTIPQAGARSGTADGLETTSVGLGVDDLESGDKLPVTPPIGHSRNPSGFEVPHVVSPMPSLRY